MNRFVYVIILIVLALATYIVDFSKFRKEKKDTTKQNNQQVPSEKDYHNEYSSNNDDIKIKKDTYFNEYETTDSDVKNNVSLKDAGLHFKTILELEKQGYTYINQLINKSDEELLAIKGIGKKTITQIRGFKL